MTTSGYLRGFEYDQKSSPEIYSIRVFREGAAHFDPNERIEIYYRKKDRGPGLSALGGQCSANIR